MIKKVLFLLSLSVFGILKVNGQSLRFTHLTLKDGLPNSLVFSIAQDKNGFIWFGTNNGLVRYDGYSFRVFQPNPKKSFGISDKSVFKVYSDLKGNLWASIQGKGLNKMDLKTERFTYYFPDVKNNFTLSGNEVKCIFEDNDSSLWIATNKGLDLYDVKNDRFISYLPDSKIQNTTINYPIKDAFSNSEGKVWFLSESCIGQVDKKMFAIRSLGTMLSKPEIDKMQIHSMAKDALGNIWFCTQNNGVFCYHPKENKISNFLAGYSNLRSLFIDKRGDLLVYADRPYNQLLVIDGADFVKGKVKSFSIIEDPNILNSLRFAEDNLGNVYISSFLGIEAYNPQNGLSHYVGNEYLPGALMGNHIEALFVDNTENLWVSISRKGIDKADLLQKPFKWYLSDPFDKNNSLAGNNIISIYEDRQKNLWIGCFEDGLTRFNRTTNKFTTIPIDINNSSKLNFNAPTAMYHDKDGYLWVGYYDGQLDKIDTRTLQIWHYKQQSSGTPYYFEGSRVRKILPDKAGNIWLASTLGIIEMEKKTGRFIYHSRLYEKNYESNYLYRTMHVDKQDIVWAGTQNGGLIKYDKATKHFIHFRNDPKDKQSISSNFVYVIYEDKEGVMWIGTSLGLNKFDRKTGKFIRIGTKEGISPYAIYSILPDTVGNFWMSSDVGLLKLNVKTLEVTKYYESDGLVSGEFNTTASCLSSTGEMFFGTPSGMVSFYPTAFTINPYGAKPVITDLRIFNKSISPGDSLNNRIVLKQQIWTTKEIELYYKENDFTLEFSALHFAAPKKIQYSYKLEGFNDDWVNVDAGRRWAVFTGLEPGNYTFRLKATNNDYVYCKLADEVSLKINIIPPFYKTLWFRLLVILTIIVLTLLYSRRRVVRLRTQKKLLEIKVKERTSELEEVNVMLEEKQEEIGLQKEELTTQNDRLEETNVILVQQKEQITHQNRELDKHRNELASLVEERTRDLERALKKAEEADRLKTAFLANMSHEIRTPMNAIIGFSRLLREKELRDKADEFVEIINSNGETLMVLINDILDLSKIQANQMELHPLPLKVAPFLNELNKVFSIDTSKKNLTLKLSTDKITDDFVLFTDKIRFKQVISNLLTNAIKFTQHGGIEFGVQNIKDNITFYVKDTGIGIPASFGNTIFERFLKIEDSKEKLFGGTGLGLAICKSLVELWGGEIWYESEINVGTTFFFTHPVHDGMEVSYPQPKVLKEGPVQTDFSGKTLLIAEDESANYLLIKAYLQKTNIGITWVRNGADAVEFATKNQPDLILMDIKMPVMNGIEAMKQIKMLKPQMPIIAHTAFAFEKEIKEFLISGFDDYITKPVKIEDLISKLKDFI